MPFTPFHMGVGLVAKATSDARFSLTSFALAQIAMDIEPGIRMLHGEAVLHGFSHTLGGALLVAAIVGIVSPWIVRPLVARWNAEAAHYRKDWLMLPQPPSQSAVAVGAFFGTFSHVLLDALIHADMQPFAPFTQTNPLLGWMGHDAVYLGCAVAIFVGALVWLLRKRLCP